MRDVRIDELWIRDTVVSGARVNGLIREVLQTPSRISKREHLSCMGKRIARYGQVFSRSLHARDDPV